MSAMDKLQALKSRGFGTPPKPEDAPDTMRKAEVIPEVGATPDPEPKQAPLETAAQGKLASANDRTPPTKSKAPTKSKRKAGSDGVVQVNGRVSKDVRLAIQIASKKHEMEIGEIITEAFALWQKKHGA